jgi:hypothetical protein
MSIGIIALIFMRIMMGRDVKSYSSTTTHVNTVRLLFNSPALRDKILIIVEGESDRKIYSYLFDSSAIQFYENGSCDGIPDILEKLNVNYLNRCIAIKDADFDHLENKTYDLPNLFLTDCHDIEMMLIDEDLEEKICCEFLDESCKCVKNCMADLKIVFYLKWYNISEHLCLNVRSFAHLGDIYNGRSAVDLDSCVKKLYQTAGNKEKSPDIGQKLVAFIASHATEDYKNLTNGHDLCNALLLYVRARGGMTSSEEISKLARAAYSLNKFKSTRLFRDISNWEQSNGKLVLKRR